MRSPVPRFLMSLPELKLSLAFSSLYSLTEVAGTLFAWIVAARLISAALLSHTLPKWSDLLLVAAGLLVRALAQSFRARHNAHSAARSVRRWRDRATAAALNLGPAALAGEQSSDLALLNGDLEARLTPYYARYLPQAAHAAVAALAVLAATLWLDPPTALVLALTGPLTVVFLALVGLAAQAETEQQWLAHLRLGARLVTLTRNLPTLHAFGQVQTYRALLDTSAAAHRVTTLKVLRVAFLSGFVLDFAATLSTALAAVWIGVRLFGGHAALAPTLAALMLMPEFFGPLRQLGADRHAALDAEPLARRLQALLSVQVAPSGELTRPPAAPHIILHQARADLKAPIFPLTLDLAPGTHLALRGPSGSGKTSLLHALRKHRPHTGQVLVDGVPLDALNAANWQAQVAYVPQSPRLLAASVWDNLRLLRPQASDAEALETVRQVGLNRVLGSLPSGLDTLLGEGGVLLSGGETARLALARVLLSGAGLVLLDEVTAHLDDETATQIGAVIGQVFAGRTVILATHRAAPAGFREVPLTRPEVAA